MEPPPSRSRQARKAPAEKPDPSKKVTPNQVSGRRFALGSQTETINSHIPCSGSCINVIKTN